MNPNARNLTHHKARQMLLSGRVLTAEESISVMEHLKSCPDCREWSAFHSELTSALPRVYPPARHSEREILAKAKAIQSTLEKKNMASRIHLGVRQAVLFGFLAVVLIALLAALPKVMPRPAGGTPTRLPGTRLPGTRTPASTFTLPALPPVQTGTETPAPPTTTPEPSPVSVSAVLSLFPLAPGNTWIYTYSEYTQAGSDPLKTIQGIYEVTRQVVEVRPLGEVTLVHIRQAVKKVSEDPGFSDSEGAPSIPDSFWYILHADKVYSTVYLPIDLKAIDYTQLTLEYVFPMAKGAEWCPSPIGKASVNDPATPVPCHPIGRRFVLGTEPIQSAAGSFDRCYQLEDEWNTGSIFQTFCDGVGMVEQKFDHAGSLFGFEQKLTRFTPGTPGTPLLPTSTLAAPQLTDEQVMSRALFGNNEKAFCSWEILGYHAQGEYAWATCAAQGAASPSVKSMPVVIYLDDDGRIHQVIVPGDGAAYAVDVQSLFPPDVQKTIADIQQATSDLTIQALADGIKLRVSGQIHEPYVIPFFDPGGATCSASDKAADHVAPVSGFNGWQNVSVPEAGFSFIAPDDWTVIESWSACGKDPVTPHYLFLQSPDPTFQLAIGFRRPDQVVWLTRTGTPAGDFVDAGKLLFMGKSVQIQRLVYGKRDMAVFYNGSAEFPAGGILFTLSLDIISDPKNDQSIPANLETQAAKILASFQMMPSPTPTP